MTTTLTDPTLVPQHIMDAWRDHDAEAFAHAFAVDGVMILPGVCQVGRPAIEEFMRHAFAGPYRGTQVVGEPFDVRVLTSDVTVLLTQGGVRGADEATLDDGARVRATWVLHRTGDQWHIVSYANSPW